MPHHDDTACSIEIRGACQHSLKNLDLDLPLKSLIVVTGVSGSGKSSLAFDTVFAEAQRRYVETFSAYARQFLDRMDRPQVERVSHIPPGIAVAQSNPVRTSRSTVGTMSELNDHLKLLIARFGTLYCAKCYQAVKQEHSESVAKQLLREAAEQRIAVLFDLPVPENLGTEKLLTWLQSQGFTQILRQDDEQVTVIQDRLRLSQDNRARLAEALDSAFRLGSGQLEIGYYDAERNIHHTQRFSSHFHCANCQVDYKAPLANHFSFNSPLGACESCRGFGRTIGIDYTLAIPDTSLSLRQGCIKPWQTKTNAFCQRDLLQYAKARNIDLDQPWSALSEADRQWIIDGDGPWDGQHWYGLKRFFDYLESQAYKMHIRVLLSKYRRYSPCAECQGARLKPESLLWRLGDQALATDVLGEQTRFCHPAFAPVDQAQWQALPGLCLHDIMQLPLDKTLRFFQQLQLGESKDRAASELLKEILTRLGYLNTVGLSYLSLDRQSRTLSGGEVQRINLTTALGTSLVNTLFVLDEPSIGLHPRDMDRVISIMRQLQQAGNTLLVVEHDPQVMLAADYILDLGPGAGPLGGQIQYFGPAAELINCPQSLTAEYLRGETPVRNASRKAQPVTHWLSLTGACGHNLKKLDFRLPLGQLVCVTGVSGSGKSTLIQDTLCPAILQALGQAQQTPQPFTQLEGLEAIDALAFVDQSPIGKTTRSNTASYTGAFDSIRQSFAKQPSAKARQYTAGSFSFNSSMKCPDCGGNGFEHVEMQFLSDVYLRCASCNGSRYQAEVLEITQRGANGVEANIADVLAMTTVEALAFFADQAKICRALQPLVDVGLDYLTLGQAVPTLSGGEAQRLKLAAHLIGSKKRDSTHTLFVFDEPTTGLHFADIKKLLSAFEQLLEAGHSVLVIEHNVEVMLAADYLIDIGPEGGEYGGELVASGTPEQLAKHPTSHTAAALRQALQTSQTTLLAQVAEPLASYQAPRAAEPHTAIVLQNARENNLQGISLSIPHDKLTVISGLSGSGKSTLAFDILYAEGQRRYLESLNAYARQFVQPPSRPQIDALYGMPPTVAIEQRTSRGGRKSTVATLTEIHHYLRLLMVTLGQAHCPECQIPIEAISPETLLTQLQQRYQGRTLSLLAPLVVGRKGHYRELAKWAAEKGYPALRVDGQLTPTQDWPALDRYSNHDIELPITDIHLSAGNLAALGEALETTLALGKSRCLVIDQQDQQSALFSVNHTCTDCGQGFAPLDPRLFSYNSPLGWCQRCYGTGEALSDFNPEEHSGEESQWLESDVSEGVCPECHGARLNPVACAVRFKGYSLIELSQLSLLEVSQTLSKLGLNEREQAIGGDLIDEIQRRLGFLQQLGLSYLSLDRSAPSLSGGEAQRIRLAAQLGSSLSGVAYILDEPTIGLHPRDNALLLNTLKQLRQQGNTVIVVEHDEDTILAAEHLIDLGPGAGVRGGQIIAQGTPAAVMQHPDSLTGRCLAAKRTAPPTRNSEPAAQQLRIKAARFHNLRDLSLSLPLKRLVGVSGVSGSGKSTLVHAVLKHELTRLHAGATKPQRCQAIEGWQPIERLLEVDQTPIGKTPRSCPATYLGIFDPIRKAFANTQSAAMRGFSARRFSFNTKGGRCEACDGQGQVSIEMSFLPNVKVRCELCNGQRFNQETLAVHYKGRSIAEVLAMEVDEAVEFFAHQPAIAHPLRLLQDVGLGYLTLGQQSPTLSGGEAQRVKLVTELAKAKLDGVPRRGKLTQHHLYLLDEPTVGLHMADVDKLAALLRRLVEAGHSVIVIEHNLAMLSACDHLIELGPEGGNHGGELLAEGSLEALLQNPASQTGRYLAQYWQTPVTLP